jgi:hypothetical protein
VERLVVQVRSSPWVGPVGVLLFLFSIFIALGITYLNALGKSALVDQVYRIENGRRPSRAEGWAMGKAKAEPVFLIMLLLGLPVFLLIAIGLVAYLITIRGIAPSLPEPMSNLPAIGASLACLAPTFCLGLILTVPLHILQRLAVLVCILEERPPWESVTRGWEMLKNNVGPVLTIWLTVLIISLGVALVIGAPCGGVMFALRTVEWVTDAASWGLALVSTLLMWLIGLAVNSVLETFRTALWTLGYRQLTGMGRRGEHSS